MTRRQSDRATVRMVQWNFEIPPPSAQRFVEDMRAYHAETDSCKREAIAAKQAWLLNEHLGVRRVKTCEVAEGFALMKLR